MIQPVDPYQITQASVAPLFDPVTGLYSTTSHPPPHMFIPHSRPPTQSMPQSPQYYMAPQQQHPAQPFGSPYQDRPLQLTQPAAVPANINYAMQTNPLTDQSDVLKTCLQHFATYEKLRLSVLLPDQAFVRLVQEYIPIYEPLANAVGSLAARNLSQQQLVYVQAAVDFKIKALNLLRQDLVYQGVSESSLLCMLILGNFEMNDLNIEAWSQHLDGAAKAASEILARHNVFENPDSYSNFMLILEVLTYQDIMSGLTLGKRPRLHDIYRHHLKYVSEKCVVVKPPTLALSEILCLAADLQENYPSTLFRFGMKSPSHYAVDRSYYTPEIARRYDEILASISSPQTPSASGNSEAAMLMQAWQPALQLYFMLRLDAHEFLYTLSPRVEKLRAEALAALLKCPPTKFMAIQQPILIYFVGIVCEATHDHNALINRIKDLYAEMPRPALYSIMKYLSNLWKMRQSPKYKEYTYRDLLSSAAEQTGFMIVP